MFQWVSVERPDGHVHAWRDILHSGVQRGEAKDEQGSESDTGGGRKKSLSSIAPVHKTLATNSG